MSRYRRVPTATWDKAWFRALSRPQPNAQTLWVFFVSGPQTSIIPGLFAAGEAALAEALGWNLAGFRRAFRELEAQHLAKADWAVRVVWIPSVLADNPPESTNVLRAWRTAFDEMPDGPLTSEARAAVEALVEGLTEPFRKAFAEGSRKASGMPKPIQEQEAVAGTDPRTQEQDSPPTPSQAHTSTNRSGVRTPSRKHVDAAWVDRDPVRAQW